MPLQNRIVVEETVNNDNFPERKYDKQKDTRKIDEEYLEYIQQLYEAGKLPEDVDWKELGIDPQQLLDYMSRNEEKHRQ